MLHLLLSPSVTYFCQIIWHESERDFFPKLSQHYSLATSIPTLNHHVQWVLKETEMSLRPTWSSGLLHREHFLWELLPAGTAWHTPEPLKCPSSLNSFLSAFGGPWGCSQSLSGFLFSMEKEVWVPLQLGFFPSWFFFFKSSHGYKGNILVLRYFIYMFEVVMNV